MIEAFLTENVVIFNTVAGISVMGTILEELEDSFIVGLPARLVRQQGVLGCEAYVPAALTRFFKGTILNYVGIEGDFELPYLQYLIENKDRLEMKSDLEAEIQCRVSELLAEKSADVVELPSHVKYIFPDSETIH
jgi:hypothetical protein